MPKGTDNLQKLQDEALARSVVYGVLSLALHHPTELTFARLASEETRLSLSEAAQLLQAGEQPPGLTTAAEEWIERMCGITLEEAVRAYGRFFGHTARGPVCLYETEYGQDGLFQQPQQLAKIEGFYRAFGLTSRTAERERADHASCELEFLEFLSRKEAYALECADHSMLHETRKAIRLFLKDHVGRFGRALGYLLKEHDPQSFLGKLGEVLSEFVAFECRRAGIEAGPPQSRLRSQLDDDVPMACGTETDLVELRTE